MKIVLAFDSFKGSLAAREACRIAAATLAAFQPAWEVIAKPVADGGEGTAETMLSAMPGEWCPCRVMGPLPEQEVEAGFAWFPAERTALVELATASGLTLVPAGALNPLRATTFGTGQLLRQALARQPRRILLAVGGSATVDGGVGAAMALGWRFLDAAGQEVGLGGAGVEAIAHVVPPAPPLPLPPIEVLCDVDNPLCGARGAAAVYGPQKGATPEMVRRLDQALCRLAGLLPLPDGRDLATVPGGGAAGGMAAGALAFLGARLVPGIEAVLTACRMDEALRGADWVITGEGRFDAQSLQGKVVSGILQAARRHQVKVAVLAGQVALGAAEWQAAGVAQAHGLVPPGPVTPAQLQAAGARLAEQVRALAARLA